MSPLCRPAVHLALPLLALLWCSSCSSSEAPADELVFVIGAWPTNLDPRFAPDAWSDKIAKLVFSPLVHATADGGFAPHLAESVTFETPTSVLIALRSDVRFSDGTPLTPADVVSTYRSILDPDLGSVKRLFLEPIARIEAVGTTGVRFELRQAHAPFLQVLASVGIAPAREVRESTNSGAPVWTGSGPFVFDSVERGATLRLKRNSDWFMGPVGPPMIRFRVVPDATVRSLELLRGSADITQNDLPPHVLQHLGEADGVVVERMESTLVKYLAFNLTRPPLDDVRVRRAVAMAINREAITAHKLRGYATVAESFLHPDSWAYADDVAPLRYDPEAARALLDAAGFPAPEGGAPRLRIVYRTSQDETAIAVARILVRDLAAVGIDMELQANEWGVFFADIKQGNFDLYSLSGVGINDPDWYSFVMHSASQPPHGANRERYSDPTMDALLDAGRGTLDPAIRASLYRSVQHLAARDLPLVPLWYQHNVTVRGANVRGWSMEPGGGLSALVHTTKDGSR